MSRIWLCSCGGQMVTVESRDLAWDRKWILWWASGFIQAFITACLLIEAIVVTLKTVDLCFKTLNHRPTFFKVVATGLVNTKYCKSKSVVVVSKAHSGISWPAEQVRNFNRQCCNRAVSWVSLCVKNTRAAHKLDLYSYEQDFTESTLLWSTKSYSSQRRYLYFTFVWTCIVTNVLLIKPTKCTNFTNLFWHEILHVSNSSSVHHQEFIHCTLSSGICHIAFEQDQDGTKLYDIYHCWVYSE
jgi:hypothetical protein